MHHCWHHQLSPFSIVRSAMETVTIEALNGLCFHQAGVVHVTCCCKQFESVPTLVVLACLIGFQLVFIGFAEVHWKSWERHSIGWARPQQFPPWIVALNPAFSPKCAENNRCLMMPPSQCFHLVVAFSTLIEWRAPCFRDSLQSASFQNKLGKSHYCCWRDVGHAKTVFR